MPNEIKTALALLLLSSVVAISGTYIDGLHLNENGELDPLMLGMDFMWFCIIVWLMYLLCVNKTDIRKTVAIVMSIIAAFNIWEFIEFGVSLGLIAYTIEFLIFLVVLVFLNRKNSKEWLEIKSI
ncbi:MAG: hypothetical protein ACI96N_003363 [Arenicella sp.]|jgi:hypothetical protein